MGCTRTRKENFPCALIKSLHDHAAIYTRGSSFVLWREKEEEKNLFRKTEMFEPRVSETRWKNWNIFLLFFFLSVPFFLKIVEMFFLLRSLSCHHSDYRGGGIKIREKYERFLVFSFSFESLRKKETSRQNVITISSFQLNRCKRLARFIKEYIVFFTTFLVYSICLVWGYG